NHIRVAHFKLIGITAAGETTLLVDSGDNVQMAKEFFPARWSDTYRIYPISQPNDAWDRLTPEDRASADALVTHVETNRIYYSRAIWLAEDPGTRATRFDAIPFDAGGTVLDLIQNRPLDVLGWDIAFPMDRDSFDAIITNLEIPFVEPTIPAA